MIAAICPIAKGGDYTMPAKSTPRGKATEARAEVRREVIWLQIDQLHFDPLNPRLPEGLENARQAELLETLADEYELRELAQSLVDNGYFSEEPLVVIPGKRKNTFVVVEGNRRLAALKLLDDPAAAPKPYRARWREIARDCQHRITLVPALPYENREQIIPYLGFRHITGVLPWRPYQKARYIAQLVEISRMTFAQVARIIGSRPPTVRDHYIGYTLLRQAGESFGIDTGPVENSFGVLRRALNDPDIRNFMGLKFDQSETKLAKPIPRSKSSQIHELLSWMFGDDEYEAALQDSRQIKMLGTVLAQKESTKVLRDTRDLEYAFEMAGGEEVRLLESLNKASYYLDQALPMALRHTSKKQVIRAVRRCYQVFNEILRHFPDSKEVE